MERKPIDIEVFRKWVETWFNSNNIMSIGFTKDWNTPAKQSEIADQLKAKTGVNLDFMKVSEPLNPQDFVSKLLGLDDKQLLAVMFEILLKWKERCRYWNNIKNKATLPFFIFVLEKHLNVAYKDSKYYYDPSKWANKKKEAAVNKDGEKVVNL